MNYQAFPNGDMAVKFLYITYAQQNERQTIILDNLNEFANYSIGVLAFTVFGNGPASVAYVVETLEGSKFFGSTHLCCYLYCFCVRQCLAHTIKKNDCGCLGEFFNISHSVHH